MNGVRKLEERGAIRRISGPGPIRYSREAIEALHSSRLAPNYDEIEAAAAPTLRRLDARAEEAEAAKADAEAAEARQASQQRFLAEQQRQIAEFACGSRELDRFDLCRRWGLDRESWLVARKLIAAQTGQSPIFGRWYPEQVAEFERQCRYVASSSPVGMPADKLGVWQVCREIALRAPLAPGEQPPTLAPLPAPPPDADADALMALVKLLLALGGTAAGVAALSPEARAAMLRFVRRGA